MPKVRIDDTLEMYYEDDDFTDPWKTSETVVLQHCNGGSCRMYYRWVPGIARHYQMIRVDRRGQGQSTVPPPGYPWSLKGWAQEIGAFLDRLGLRKVHLIGDATGSDVSLQYAYEHPERVSSLTLVNLVNRGASPAGQAIMSEYGKTVEEDGLEAGVRRTMKSRFDPAQVDPEYIEWHLQEKLRQPQHVTAEVLMYMGTLDVSEILPEVKVPTMIIAGERGIPYTPEVAERLKEQIPNAKVAVIPGVFGFVAHVAPEKCAEAWLEFVRALN